MTTPSHNLDALRQPMHKPAKYRNQRVEIDGMKFDSKAEARRYAELRTLERAGLIRDLKRQVSFELAPGVKLRGQKRASPPLRYVADFIYQEAGALVVEDVKGTITEGYRIKRHLLKAVHGIDIVEVH